MVNSSDEGEYFDGIAPAKSATDDITHDFDDRNEQCLKQAISYLQTGAFTSKSAAAEIFSRHIQLDEKPSWISNAFGTVMQETVNK
jgi:hypothetical protein